MGEAKLRGTQNERKAAAKPKKRKPSARELKSISLKVAYEVIGAALTRATGKSGK